MATEKSDEKTVKVHHPHVGARSERTIKASALKQYEAKGWVKGAAKSAD